MFLILGLGNPGPRYELTRHNIGFLVIDALAEKHQIQLDQHKYFSLFGKGKINGCPVMVSKPMTYMNESGKAALSFLKAFDLLPEQLVVVHDEIDLALGKIKRKTKGGDAGNRGIGSIIDRIGTDQFIRFRLGVDRPDNKEEIVDYVLTPFKEEEWPQVNDMIDQAVARIEATLKELYEKSLNQTEEQ